MKKIILLAIITIVIFIGGFFILNSYIYNQEQRTQEPPPLIVKDFEGEADPSRMTLGMQTWTWISATYNDGKKIIPKKEKVFTLTLTDKGTFSATTDCNNLSGKYSVNKNQITFSQIASTKMYCEGSQESDFTTLLQNTQSYFFTSKGEMIFDLKFDSGSVTFR